MNCKPLHKCKIMHINFKQSTNVRFANFLARSEMKIGFYEVSFQTFTESMESLRLDAAAYKLQRGGQSKIPRENTAQREALGVSSVFWVFVRNKKNIWVLTPGFLKQNHCFNNILGDVVFRGHALEAQR